MGDVTRKQQPKIPSYLNHALADDAGVLVTASAALMPAYVATPIAMTALESSPNTSAPSVTRMIFAGDQDTSKTVSSIVLWPEFTAATGSVSLAVWVKSGLPAATGNEWVRVKVITFDGSASDVEQVVNVGNRTAFIQAVSGVDTKPINLYYAVA